MNVDRLTTIKNYLKKPTEGFTQGFNMSGWGGETNICYPDRLGEPEQCGTVHCIAGLANVFWGDDPERYSDLYRISLEILDLTDEQAGELFFARQYNGYIDDITPAQAVRAIDSLIDTGAVSWQESTT